MSIASTARGGRTIRTPFLIRIVLRRVVVAVPLIFVVSALTFILLSLTPGDAAQQILGTSATPASLAALRETLHLNEPLYQQYAAWVGSAAHGDLGTSLISGAPVMKSVQSRFPVTLSLVIGALLISLVVGISLGIVSAVRSGVLGKAIDALALLGWALPIFWLAPELVVIFAVKLQWLPAVGYVQFADSPVDWFRSLLLPWFALSLGAIAAIAKQTREAMLDVLGSEYIRIARANGIRQRSLTYRHALKNAAMRIVTVLGVQTIGLFGGALFVETVFALPGMGTLLVQSALTQDVPVVLGVAVVFTLVVITVNLLVDVAYGYLNPKVRSA